MIKYILTIIYIVFTSLGLFFMKLGQNNPLSLSLNNGINIKIGFISLLGFVFYICSFLLWQKLLVSFDLSYIVPIATGVVQILVLLVGHFFFKEAMSPINITGILLIILGLVLVSLKK